MSDAAAVARRAVEILQHGGWCQRTGRDNAGRHCLLGAVFAAETELVTGARWPHHYPSRAVRYAAQDALHGARLVTWNDAPERIQAEVEKLLLQVADRLEFTADA